MVKWQTHSLVTDNDHQQREGRTWEASNLRERRQRELSPTQSSSRVSETQPSYPSSSTISGSLQRLSTPHALECSPRLSDASVSPPPPEYSRSITIRAPENVYTYVTSAHSPGSPSIYIEWVWFGELHQQFECCLCRACAPEVEHFQDSLWKSGENYCCWACQVIQALCRWLCHGVYCTEKSHTPIHPFTPEAGQQFEDERSFSMRRKTPKDMASWVSKWVI